MELWRQLLLNGAIKLFWSKDVLEDYINEITKEKFNIYSLDCSKWNLKNYHEYLASSLHFPDYYGKNLDAFNDCLSDMIPEGIGICLVFRNYEFFSRNYPEDAYHILDIIQRNSWRFLLLEDRKLIAFVQSNDPTIGFTNLGGMSAEWNNEEWLNKARGI
ncbi:MAG: barstar family protein [Bacillaceae bacterium]|nr:barstar family protein [Bacillaceae bacterium]